MNWGLADIPAGFVSERDDHGRLLVVRDECRDYLTIGVVCDGGAPSSHQGRGPLGSVALRGGERALVRRYLHGGLLRNFTGDLFWSWPPRPVRELAITEELRRRGVPTVKPCGACIEPVWGPLYRGWFITRELSGAANLWDTVSTKSLSEGDLCAVFQAAAASVSRLHREGVYHRDLNLRNLLMRREAESFRSYVIDFDKATLFLGRVPEKLARRNLQRLERSVRKLDRHRRYVTDGHWRFFLDRYHASRDVRD